MALGAVVQPGTPIINSSGNLIVSQCLGQDTVNQINSRLTGKSPTTAKNLFSTNTGLGNSAYLYTDGTGIQYVRNTSLWCADIAQQLTAFSPWNNVWVQPYPDATLITPRHAITVAHFGVSVGWKFHYVDINNNIHVATVIGATNSPHYVSAPMFDYQIIVFDADLPSTISPIPIAGNSFNLAQYALATNPTAVLFRDQLNNVGVRDLYYADSQQVSYQLSSDSLRAQFFSQAIPGDSGSPVGVIVNNQAALITSSSIAYYVSGFTPAQNWASGCNFTQDIANIQALITASDAQVGIDTGYQANIVNLSGFPQY